MPTTPLELHSKLPNVGTTIFTVMSALAAKHGAINLSQGFPDFDCDPDLASLVTAHMAQGRNQYAPMTGVGTLREAIAAKCQELYGARYDPDTEVTITSGGTEALFDAITALVRSGDEVLLFEPCYDSYVPAVELAGGTPVFVSLRYPDYRVDWDDVRRAVSSRTRLILINTPHNPTGTAFLPEDVEQLRKVLTSTSALVLSDEVYEHIIFDGLAHESMARYPDLASRSMIVGSFGKTFHTTGWKVGYLVAPAALSTEIRKVHQFVTFATHTPTQHALADFLRRREKYLELPAFYQQKRDLFLQLVAPSRFTPIACRGSYFQLLDYSAITDEVDHEFAIRLTTEHGVASIPTSSFLYQQDAPPVLRFCFAKKEETLRKAAERLCTL